MNTALVCIAKNEDNYIEEWIAYNIKLGFSHIYIYTNNWIYRTTNPQVTLIDFPGEQQQLNAYNSFILSYRDKYDWAAFFDVDEFLVLNKHKTLKDFLIEYNDCNAIGINWAIFGNNSHQKVIDNNYNVLSRFTRRNDENYVMNIHIKTIINLSFKNHRFINPHHISGNWYNLNKQIRSGPYNEPVDWTIAKLNHYFTKSNEEFLSKIDRGRADMLQKRQYDDHIHNLTANNIEDLKALNFFNTL